MLFVALTFVGILALVTGTYWVLFERSESREQGQLRNRLRAAVGQKIAKRIDFLKDTEKQSAITSLDAALERSDRIAGPLKKLLARADMKLSVGGLLLISAGLFLGGWFAISWFARLWWLGLGVGCILACVPFVVVRFKAARRIRTFEEQFPEAIDLIARALRAGHAFTTGLALVSEEAPQPVAGEFRLLYDQQNFGMPLDEALKALAERVPLLDARFFVTAVLTQRESGGNLAEILANLANVIRDRFKVKRQIRVISAHGRITGWVLSGLPPSLAAAMMVLMPGHIKTLIEDPMGPPMVIAAIVLQTVGMLIIKKLVNIEY
ncbi:MAG TPA: type II secretion system F family protein [Vicinamibacterales bacterium]|nr:type II secretion system F family protein [Vicinamibacterales bacterium]